MSDRVILSARGPDAVPDTKSFGGDFMLTIRVRRQTFEEVEGVAQQLLGMFPDETFLIDRQIARVKMVAGQGKAA